MGASTLATPVPGLLVLLLREPLLMGVLQPASIKSLLWLTTPAGCTLGRDDTLSVCRVARRLAMLPLSRAPRAASLDADDWLLTLLLWDMPAGRCSLDCSALRVLR